MELQKSTTRLDQLLQIAKSPVWDGDLISKADAKELHKSKFVDRAHGFSFITGKGIECLCHLGFVRI